MKKRLLLQAMAVLCSVGAYAYDVDDFFYTIYGKYQVQGANIVENGDFSNGTEGWTNGKGDEVDAFTWSVEDGIGPNGEAAVQSVASEDGDDAALVHLWAPDAGTYVVSFDIMTVGAEGATSITVGGSNYIDVFVTNDASLVKGATDAETGYPRAVAAVTSFTAEWATVNYITDIAIGEFITMRLEKVAEGVSITNVCIQKVRQVYDTRIMERRMGYFKALLDIPEDELMDTDARVDLLDDYEYITEGLETDGESLDEDITDVEAMEGLMSSIENNAERFLTANSADMMQFVSPTTWAGGGNRQKMTSWGDWVLAGGRWFHGGSNTNDALNEMRSFYQWGYDMPHSVATLTKSGGNWTAGKYLFAIQAKAAMMTSKTDNYTADPTRPISGATMRINDQVLDMGELPVVIHAGSGDADMSDYKTYVVVADVPEGDIVFEVDHQLPEAWVGQKRGGSFYLANCVIRKFGASQLALDFKSAVDAYVVQQNAMLERINDINDNLAVKTKADGYPWGQAAVKAVADECLPIYTASLDTVSADGVCSLDITQENIDALAAGTAYMLAKVRALNSARSTFSSLNASYQALVAEVQTAEALLAKYEGRGSAAARQNLQAIIAEAKQMIDATVDQSEGEKDAFDEKLAELQAAESAFTDTIANYEDPSVQNINNPNFETNLSGWTNTTDNANGAFKWGNGADRGARNAAGGVSNAWRGQTASPNNKSVQTLTITAPGVYEYKASAYSFNETVSYDNPMGFFVTDDETGMTVDTLYTNTFSKMFFGQAGLADSVFVHSHYAPGNNGNTTRRNDPENVRNGYWMSTYSVVYIKTTSVEEEVEFGMSTEGAIAKAGSNTFGFSDNQLLYGGAVEPYTAAAKAHLTQLIAKADQLAEQNADTENGLLKIRLNRMARRLADAKAALAGETVTQYVNAGGIVPQVNAETQLLKNILNTRNYLEETIEDVEQITNGTDGIAASYVPNAQSLAKGVYTIAGVKVANSAEGLKQLKAGIYIINGHKYVIE